MRVEGLYKVKKEELDICALILAEAFYNDPLILSLTNVKEYSVKKSKELFLVNLKYLYEYCHLYSLDEKLEGVIAFLNKNESAIPTWPFLKNGGLKLVKHIDMGIIKRLIDYENYAQSKHKKLAKDNHLYLFTLGVDEKHRNKGKARALLNPFFSLAKEEKCDIYLETHKKLNVDIYIKMGFELVEVGTVTKDKLNHYCMIYRSKED